MNKLFGTDGVRGIANKYPMTPDVALRLGQAIAFYFARKKGGGRIVIGKDTRRSSYMFEYALSAGISSMGSQAILTGPLPTPGIAFLINAMRADAGIVISASHNNFQDNGIKFFDNKGFKLPDDIEKQMEDFVASKHDESLNPTGSNIGRAIRVEDATGRYAEFLKSTFPKNLDLRGLKVVIDCANGAAYKIGPLVFQEMDAEVISLGVKPNGVNINDKCGALHPENLSNIVKQEGAHIGIALDGDADRVILCDEKGQIVDGDRILALCALEKASMGTLSQNTVVGTVMSNMGLEVFLRKNNMKFIRTAVGDRFIMEVMRKSGYSLGGEPSGHLIFADVSTTGDGMIGALQVLASMIRQGKPLSELAHQMPVFPQLIQNIEVKNRKDLDSIAPVKKVLAEVEKNLNGTGRVVLRYSGTEPLLRVMIEGENEDKVKANLERLSSCIKEHV
ncbi:phosphoglucosamine mutase [bacterium]|nr:phosphoglucosamine mutase [bacterium]